MYRERERDRERKIYVCYMYTHVMLHDILLYDLSPVARRSKVQAARAAFAAASAEMEPSPPSCYVLRMCAN